MSCVLKPIHGYSRIINRVARIKLVPPVPCIAHLNNATSEGSCPHTGSKHEQGPWEKIFLLMCRVHIRAEHLFFSENYCCCKQSNKGWGGGWSERLHITCTVVKTLLRTWVQSQEAHIAGLKLTQPSTLPTLANCVSSSLRVGAMNTLHN